MATKSITEKIEKLETRLDEYHAQIMTLNMVYYGDGTRSDWAPERIDAALKIQQLQNESEKIENKLCALYAQAQGN